MVLSAVGDAIDLARAEVSAAASDFMPDVLTIISYGSVTEDAYGGTSASESTVANIPCEVQDLSTFERLTQSGTASGATNRIKVPFNATTAGITARQRLTVAARGVVPERTYEVVGPPRTGSNEIFLLIDVAFKG